MRRRLFKSLIMVTLTVKAQSIVTMAVVVIHAMKVSIELPCEESQSSAASGRGAIAERGARGRGSVKGPQHEQFAGSVCPLALGVF